MQDSKSVICSDRTVKNDYWKDILLIEACTHNQLMQLTRSWFGDMPGNVSYNPAKTCVNILLCYEVAEYMKLRKNIISYH